MKGTHGVLFLFDSPRPDQVGEATVIYCEIVAPAPGIPIVFVANKQDLPNALKPEEVARLLAFEDVPVHGISALKGWNLEAPLVDLIARIREGAR